MPALWQTWERTCSPPTKHKWISESGRVLIKNGCGCRSWWQRVHAHTLIKCLLASRRHSVAQRCFADARRFAALEQFRLRLSLCLLLLGVRQASTSGECVCVCVRTDNICALIRALSYVRGRCVLPASVCVRVPLCLYACACICVPHWRYHCAGGSASGSRPAT